MDAEELLEPAVIGPSRRGWSPSAVERGVTEVVRAGTDSGPAGVTVADVDADELMSTGNCPICPELVHHNLNASKYRILTAATTPCRTSSVAITEKHIYTSSAPYTFPPRKTM